MPVSKTAAVTTPSSPPTIKQSVWRLAVVIVCALCLIIFFREFIGSGFDLIAGDIGDNRLIITILEHWRSVFHGQASYHSPSFFAPERGVLGYSEALFLFSIPYTLFRALNYDYFISFQLTLVTVKAVGFFAMYVLLARILKIERWIALLATAIFTLSNLYYYSVGHAQLMMSAVVPLLCVLICASSAAVRSSRQQLAVVLIVLGAVLEALILFTSFYIGWFALLCGAAMAVTSCAVSIIMYRGFSQVRLWLLHIWTAKRSLGAGLAAFSLASIPFITVYAPKLRETGGRQFSEVLMFSPAPLDGINVGPENLVWGRLIGKITSHLTNRVAEPEKEVGWPLVIAVVFLATTVVSGVMVLTRGRSAGRQAQLAATLGSACLILWVISLKFSPFVLRRFGLVELSPWEWVFNYVPGATAIRVTGRINHVLNVPVVIVSAIGLQALYSLLKRRSAIRQVVGVLVAVGLIAEQLNGGGTHRLSRAAETRIVERPTAPPNACRAFYVVNVAGAGRPEFATQIDGMLIAQRRSVPTINGYSGWVPEGWKLMMFGPHYIDQVRSWALSKGLDGVCSVDLATGRWTVAEVKPEVYHVGDVISFLTEGTGVRYQLEGWGDPEPGGTWTLGGQSRLLLELEDEPRSDLVLRFEAHPFIPEARPDLLMSLSVDGYKLAAWKFGRGSSVIREQVTVERRFTADRRLEVKFTNSDPISPADLGLSIDARKLGLALHTLRLSDPSGSPYRLGQTIEFRANGDASRYLWDGWGGQEPGGTWTIGRESRMLLQVTERPASDLVLELEGHAFTPPLRPNLPVSLIVNGKSIAYWNIGSHESVVRRQVVLPKSLAADRLLNVSLVNHDPRSPAEMGLSADARQLGLAVHSMRISAIQ